MLLCLLNEGSERMMRATKTLKKGIFLSAFARSKATLLTVMVALTLAIVTPAMAATGGNFILGKINSATTFSRLTANVAGPAMQIFNTNTAGNARALDLVVDAGNPPMTVNSTAGKALNLNADKVDGSDAPLWAIVDSNGTLVRSKGATGAHLHTPGLLGVYDVDFEKDVSACAVTATPVDDAISSSTSTSGLPNTVIVGTWDQNSAGTLVPSGSKFHVVVNC